MPPTLPPLARELLDTLLDRYERPGRQTVVRVALDAIRHADYFENVQVRQAVTEVLQELSSQGVLVLHAVRQQAHLLDKIDLVPDGASQLYARLERTPRAAAEAALQRRLEAQAPGAEWQAQCLAHLRQQLLAHKSVAPLRLGDDEHNRALLAALDGLARLEGPVLERVFSVRVLNNSKRFEALRGDVLHLLRRFSPQAGALGEDDRALLAAHFIERVPEYVQLAGRLTLRLGPDLCVCDPFQPSLALPASLLLQASVAGLDAAQVVTIENATVFDAFCRVRPARVLAVFTGGFASPTVIRLLAQLRAQAPRPSLLHWGDLDAGGLRILRHLRQQLGEVRPLLMDAETLADYQAHAQRLSPAVQTALAVLRREPELADMGPLIEAQLQTGLKLEQEAVPASRAVAALAG